MRRSRDDMDDLMQLALYMLPKYMKRVKKYHRKDSRGSHYDEGHYHEHDEYADLKDLMGFIEKNIIGDRGRKDDRDKKAVKGAGGEKSRDADKGPIYEEIRKKAQEQVKRIGETADKKLEGDKIEKRHDTVAKTVGQKGRDTEEVKRENENIKSIEKCFSVCDREIKNLLNRFVNKKLDICTTGDESCLFEKVNLIGSDEKLARFKDREDKILIIPVKNIVGMVLPQAVDMEKYLEGEDETMCCPFEQSLRDYFNTLIGRKVCIGTEGRGKFGYFSNSTITGTGKGFVIIENTIVLLFCKIIFIRETKLDEYKNS